MSKETGGPAFSGTYSARSDQGRGPVVEIHDKGMTLRDYFAAKAVNGLMSNEEAIQRFRSMSMTEGFESAILMATAAYQIADAMLQERAK
jgi:hypothetical protein